MSTYRRRQSSDYNQSVPETEFIPETHAYQEKHFQPTLNQPVSETHAETEYGSTVTPDRIESRAERNPRSTFTESSDQPGEDDLLNDQIGQNFQGNSDPGTQYSTPDVSSGVSSGPGGFTGIETGTVAAASSTAAASTVVASSTIASVSSVAVATAGAAIIAATLILPLIIGVPSAIVFEDISVTDTTVYYAIYFEDYEEDMDLTVSLHNNFTDRSHKVESHVISVMEKDLKPGTEYRITVYGSMGTVLEEKVIRTEKDSPYPTAVSFSNVDVTDTTASYSVQFEGYRDGMELTVNLHNESTVRNHTVDSESVSFTEEGLVPDTEYTITVYGKNDAVLGETKFWTSAVPAPKLNVTVAEFSMTDGLIHLMASLEDEGKVCSDFKAVFYDETGGKHTPVRTIDIPNFDSEITMDAGLAADTYVEGTFSVECTIGEENKVLFEKEITVYGTPYFALLAEPTITDGSMDIECLIIDPDSVRTDYHVMFFIQDEADYSTYYDDDGMMADGRYTVTGIPDYTYYSYFVKLTWEEGGETKGKVIEEKNYESPITIDPSTFTLEDTGGGEYVLNVPVTVTDPLDGWGELTMILGDPTYSSSTVGYASVVTFTGSGTVVVPVSEFALDGLSLPLTVKKAGGATFETLPEMVIGPTMTVGMASMNHVSETIGATTYEVRFDVEISDLVDDLHYLTDSSGNWIIMPMLEATMVTPPGGEMTAMRVTQTGEGSYIASFYADNWNEAMMYRYEDTFTVAGFTKDFSMVFVNDGTYEIYTTRDTSGNISACVTITSHETITNAKAVNGSTEITGTVTDLGYNDYRVTFDLTTADPYAAYRVELYNGTTPLQSYVNQTFPYPTFVSATYNESTTQATVVFNYSQGPIYMPEVPSATITQEDGVLTLVFLLDPSELNDPVHFRVSDKNSNYYWPVTWELI